MSGKELFEGMSYVDERFVDEAEHKTIAKHVTARWIKVASMAACLCLVLFSMYKLIPYWNWSVTEQAAGEGAAARPEGAIESEMHVHGSEMEQQQRKHLWHGILLSPNESNQGRRQLCLFRRW